MLSDYTPNDFSKVLVAELIEDAIAANYNKVQVVSSVSNIGNIRVTDNDSFHSTKVWIFRLYISESARNRESSRSYSVRTYERIVFFLFTLMYELVYIDLLNYWCLISSLKYCLWLIYLSSVPNNPLIFRWLHGFVIFGKRSYLMSMWFSHDSSTVSHIYYVDVLVYTHNH